MHILLIPSWYKSLTEPVLGTFFEEQARALMKAGHKVGVIYPQLAPVRALFEKKDEINHFVDDKGLPTYSIIYQSMVPKFRKLIYKKFAVAVEKVFNEYVKQYGTPDIIHAHSVFHGGMAAFFISQNHNIPFVITEHLTSFMTGGISHKDDVGLSCEIFNNADASIIVSHNFKKDIQKALKLPDDTFTVIHNMVSDIFFENVKSKSYKKGDDFIFFTNSFLLPRKNHKAILDAIKILTIDKGLKYIKLKVGGDGPLNEELHAYVNELGINEQVTFLGALSRAKVKEETDSAHAFVLASMYETFGVVLIESLACGRPVVVTDSGGPRDFINETNGIIVNDFTGEKLAAGMSVLLGKYSQYNQMQLSENCNRLFNEKKIGAELEMLYKKVLNDKSVGLQSTSPIAS